MFVKPEVRTRSGTRLVSSNPAARPETGSTPPILERAAVRAFAGDGPPAHRASGLVAATESLHCSRVSDFGDADRVAASRRRSSLVTAGETAARSRMESSGNRGGALPLVVRTRSQLEVWRTTASTEELAPRLQARTSGELPVSARSGHLAATRPRRSLVPPLSEGPSTGAPRHSRNIRPELLGQKSSSRDCQIKSENAPSTSAVARDRRLAPPGCSGRLVRPMQDRSHLLRYVWPDWPGDSWGPAAFAAWRASAAARVACSASRSAWSVSARAPSARCRASLLSTLLLCISRASEGRGFRLRNWATSPKFPLGG